jgi:altronate dehydratase
VASGRRSKGETAGHSQVSIWRNWRQTDGAQTQRLQSAAEPDGQPLEIRTDDRIVGNHQFEALHSSASYATGQIGLILPASLCAGQIARMSAEQMNRASLSSPAGASLPRPAGTRAPLRFAALVHTAGCGVSSPIARAAYAQVMLNYMAHPLVRHGLFLEHGCEKTHNDYMRRELERLGRDPQSYGWASIQMDGGLDRVLNKIEAWFRAAVSSSDAPISESVGLERLSLGLLSAGEVPDSVGRSLAALARTVIGAGGSIVVPQPATLLRSPSFLEGTLGAQPPSPSLAFGAFPRDKGFHIMETPTGHWVETLSGLGATSVELMLACSADRLMQAHPFIPLIQITAANGAPGRHGQGFDLALSDDESEWGLRILKLVLEVASRRYAPRLFEQGNVDFQITRGLLGVST